MEVTQCYRTDAQSIVSQINHQSNLLQLKRRWLLGIPSSESEQKKSKRGNIFETRSLSESLVREDDIFYDTVKSCVEEAFGLGDPEETGNRVVPDDSELPVIPDIPRAVLSCFSNLTTKGLCLLGEVLTGGRTEFEKTRSKMKRVVRDSLLEVFGSHNPNRDEELKAISRQITLLLIDPQNFWDNRVPFMTSRALFQHDAARKVLRRLGKFSRQTLIAMYKKLKGVKLSMPQLQPRREGWNRDILIKRVLKNSEKMLLAAGKEDQLPGPLAKAMAVASLSLKLMPGFHNSFATEFHQFSPETVVLQNEIIKGIWFVRTKIGMQELQIIKGLLDPNAKVSNRSLRTAIKKMLTEYLFGCSDMDTIPKSLFETLAIINKKSQKTQDINTLKNAIDKEIECILNVSAHTKQNLLDLLPANNFEADFTDAYVEDLEESDDEFGYVDNNFNSDNEMGQNEDDSSHNSCSNQDVESTGDSVPAVSNPPTATNNTEETWPATLGDRPNSFNTDGHEAKVDSGADTTKVSFEEPRETRENRTEYKNQYLAIQEVCDETSMIAYSLIGRLLEEFGNKEGLDLDWNCSLYLRKDCVNDEENSGVGEQEKASITESDGITIVRVTEELIPSFPKGGIETLRKLLGSS